ncbi:MAG TPA: zinc metalloprotease HtpX [Firmicutes bacterium]|nr:zinc metalloprotease HtpX [Bacillota bacterium]
MYEQIAGNINKTRFLIAVFIVIIGILGYAFGEMTGYGYAGLVFAILIAILMSIGSYYYSDSIVLAISHARPVTKEENPYLWNTVEGLSIAAGIPMPKVYIIEDSAPNAFATGRNPEHSAIAVTTGLLSKLNRLELEGVIAHEMSHIKNYDILISTIAVVMVGVVALLSDWMLRSFWWRGAFGGGFGGGGRRRRNGDGPVDGGIGLILLVLGLILAIVGPLIAQLLRLAISRKREFLADANGALLTRYPEGLASALEKISADTEPLEVANKATAHLYIVNPLKDRRSYMDVLFSTHPPVEERIRALRAM